MPYDNPQLYEILARQQGSGRPPSWSPEAHGAPSRLDSLAQMLASQAGRRGGRAPHWSTQLAQVAGTIGGLWAASRGDKKAAEAAAEKKQEFDAASGAAHEDLAQLFANPAGRDAGPGVSLPLQAPPGAPEGAQPPSMPTSVPEHRAHQLSPGTMAHFTNNPNQLQTQLGMRQLQRQLAQEAQAGQGGAGGGLLQALAQNMGLENVPNLSPDQWTAAAGDNPLEAAGSLAELFAGDKPPAPVKGTVVGDRLVNPFSGDVIYEPEGGGEKRDTIAINGRLVDRQSGEVIGDYSDPETPWGEKPLQGGTKRMFKLDDATGQVDPQNVRYVDTYGQMRDAMHEGYSEKGLPGVDQVKLNEWNQKNVGAIASATFAIRELMKTAPDGRPVWSHATDKGDRMWGKVKEVTGGMFGAGQMDPTAAQAIALNSNLVSALLMLRSGAAVSDQERIDKIVNGLPSPGEDPQTSARLYQMAMIEIEAFLPSFTTGQREHMESLVERMGADADQGNLGGMGVLDIQPEPGLRNEAAEAIVDDVRSRFDAGMERAGQTGRAGADQTRGAIAAAGDYIADIPGRVAAGAERAANVGRETVDAALEQARAQAQDLGEVVAQLADGSYITVPQERIQDLPTIGASLVQ